MGAAQILRTIFYVLIFTIFGGLIAANTAIAEHFSQFEPIGYSENSRYFAFEEYGMLSADGTYYSSIHILDVVDGRPVLGTPIEFELLDSEGGLFDVREQAQMAAAPILRNLRIRRPASIIAHRADGEISSGQNLIFGVPGSSEVNDVVGEYSLTLTQFDVLAASACIERTDNIVQGFALDLSGRGQAREVYSDGGLARSRGCPFSYRLAAVILPFAAVDLIGGVAIIANLNESLSGLERRFMAVPLGMPTLGPR